MEAMNMDMVDGIIPIIRYRRLQKVRLRLMHIGNGGLDHIIRSRLATAVSPAVGSGS
jgi:hypothetical protein